MNLRIRRETSADYEKVFILIEKAFRNVEYSDRKEHFLVSRLRKTSAFIPELSLVAETNHQIVGHILLSKNKSGK